MRTNLNMFIALFCAFASVAQAAEHDPVLDADPFAMEAMLAKPPSNVALREYLVGSVAASRLRADSALRHLRAAWSSRDVSPGIAWRALSSAGGVLLRIGRYSEAAALFDRAISEHGDKIATDTRLSLEQDRDFAMALRNEAAQTSTARGMAKLPMTRSKVGLFLAPVTIQGKDRSAVFDTGTSISTLSATAARELGVRMVSRPTSIGSATQAAVPITFAVAPTVQVGSVTLHNVVFAVASDEALSPMGPDTRIDVILGFPVLRALGPLTFRTLDPGKPDATREVIIREPAHPQTSNLRFEGFDFYVKTTVGGMSQVLFFDSGAQRTGFERRYAAEHPEKLVGLERREIHVAGAGGVETRHAAIIPTTTIAVGNQSVPLTDMRIEIDGSAVATRDGSLGNDVLWAKGGFTLDFDNLELSLGPH